MHAIGAAAAAPAGRNATVFDTWHVWPGAQPLGVPLYRLVGICKHDALPLFAAGRAADTFYRQRALTSV